MTLQEGRDQELIDGRGVQRDALVAIRSRGTASGGLQTAVRALARQRLAPGLLARQGAQEGILAQLVVVAHVLVAQAQAQHPLADQLSHAVFDLGAVAVIAKTASEALEDLRSPLDLAQQ